MSTVNYRFIEPLDVLFLRGNKLFGDPGSFGESLIPPWPSVAAGAIRSRMLVDDGVDLAAFSRNEKPHPTLGTPDKPGSFTLAGFYLARRQNGIAEILLPPPTDLVISKNDDGNVQVNRLQPTQVDLPSSFSLPLLPVLAQGATRSKQVSGHWLTQAGWQAYLQGKTPDATHLVSSSELWKLDARVGIGMSTATRSVEEGKLFSAQAVALAEGVGFLAAVTGAAPSESGLLRFGGDGRAASIEKVNIQLPEPDYQAISKAGRCRIVLTSPGLFPDGWQLPGSHGHSNNDNRVTLPGGISGRLACAAVSRAEVLSGWDLANKKPKPAQRIAPTGSVYWMDELQATPEQLRKLVETGLWGDLCEDAGRRSEGFNRIALAIWK
ncbi:type III-B CRISPR module-associated Cmr3 family protein [Marinimicrobium sp. ARAG 43.8]|uniref:type III-B CRISPR module-associated Cmr3 family protein n=1 Tax=Marinimicrobium sp. ARAG 43.8 TaxID=3418719 RepID=UPI003CE78694